MTSASKHTHGSETGSKFITHAHLQNEPNSQETGLSLVHTNLCQNNHPMKSVLSKIGGVCLQYAVHSLEKLFLCSAKLSNGVYVLGLKSVYLAVFPRVERKN